METRSIAVSIICAFTMLAQNASSCVTYGFSNGGRQYFVKGFMWNDETGAALINARYVRKTAIGLTSGDLPATWISKYGSLTFNQMSREFPYGGINEAGLSVEILWFSESKIPPATDPRPSINESQWIQYILDTSASVEESIVNAKKVRISKFFADVHYMACDKAGHCATFVNQDGEMRTYTGAELPFKLLDNNASETTQKSLLELLQIQRLQNTDLKIQKTGLSVPEFLEQLSTNQQLRADVQSLKGQHGLALLDVISGKMDSGVVVSASLAPIQNNSEWQINYNLTDRVVSYRTKSFTQIKSLDLKRLDFSCSLEPRGLDLSYNVAGDATTKIGHYGIETNLAQLQRALAVQKLNPQIAEIGARYLSTITCASQAEAEAQFGSNGK